MATRERANRTTVRSTLASVVRLVLVAAFTGVETVALGVWLVIVRDAPAVSRATVIGLAILVGSLVVEHFLTDVAVNGLDASVPGCPVIAFSVTETALWALWLVVAERVGGPEGVLLAGGLLATLLVPQHTVEDNVLRGERLLSDLVDLDTVGFSLIEAGGATVWLAFVFESEAVEPLLEEVGVVVVEPATVGLAVLAAALFAEHVVGVGFSRRP